MNHLLRAAGALGLFVAASSAWASISVGSGGSISLGGGALELAGGSLTIDGEFDVASGRVAEAGDVVINGTLDGGTGSVGVRGDWINGGTFNAGAGLVRFIDEVGGSAQLVGNSTFFGLALLSAAGGEFVMQSGSVQRVVDNLTIQGASGLPVQIRSSNPPQIAQLLLEQGGAQDIAFVGVSDVHATGEPLAPDGTNQGGTGNDRGWFGSGLQLVPVPAMSIPGLAILILALFGLALTRRAGTA